jgi:hypothetical protein
LNKENQSQTIILPTPSMVAQIGPIQVASVPKIRCKSTRTRNKLKKKKKSATTQEDMLYTEKNTHHNKN